jgi:UDP-N-acetylmuramate--alanine ligase
MPQSIPLIHFVGVAGSGMSALAQFHLMGGGRACGSDRSFDRGQSRAVREKLAALGLRVFPQDASAFINNKPDYVVASGAVEDKIPDLARAKALGIPVRHRADELSAHVEAFRSVAIAGTSGKSTVAGMLFEILEEAGLDPSIITGGELVALKARGLIGNAWRGRSLRLVVEADESDGTIVRHRPEIGVLLNISKDHKDIPELERMFHEFQSRSKTFLAADAPGLGAFHGGARTFGFERGDIRAENLSLGPEGSRFELRGIPFSISWPGLHNAENALAATAAAHACGVPLEAAAKALKNFAGIARRFELVGRAGGVEVVDDYAHNPAKVAAALAAARLRAKRVLAVFQLHGYFPARFMRKEFIEALSTGLRPGDRLWMTEIYYAGGTTAKDISAEDFVREIAARGRRAVFAPAREELPRELAKESKAGDLILVMGARDPSLPGFAQEVLESLKRQGSLNAPPGRGPSGPSGPSAR